MALNNIDMEIIAVESQAYHELMDRLQRIEQYIDRTSHLLQDIDDELEMSTKDLIETLSVSESTLYRWRKKPRCPLLFQVHCHCCQV